MKKSINTFRMFAFLGIFLFHSINIGFGYLGVNAFFVLSGYLITPILLSTKIQNPDFKGFLVNFYGRRFFRIFPPYYLYLAVISAFIFIKGLQNTGDYKDFIAQLPWALTYTYDFYHASTAFKPNDLLIHFWSLAVEEQFYIFFPIVIFLVPKEKLKIFFITLIALGPVIRLLTALAVDYPTWGFLNTWKDMTIYVSPFSHIDAFVIGGFFSVFIKKYQPSTSLLTFSFVGIVALGLLTSALFSPGTKIPFTSLGYPPFMKDAYKYIWGYTLLSFFFAFVLLRLNARNFFPAIFENKTLDYFGKISYGLYIYHFAILRWISGMSNDWHITSPLAQKIVVSIVTLAITIVVSIVSFELFEKKLMVFKDKIFPKKQKTNPARIVHTIETVLRPPFVRL